MKIAIAADGLCGVLTALRLLKQGHQVVLIESGEGWTAEFERARLHGRLWPDDDVTRTAFHNLASISDTKFELSHTDFSIRTYEPGGWRDFVGFGDNKSLATQFYTHLPVNGWLGLATEWSESWAALNGAIEAAVESKKLKRIKYSEISLIETNGPNVAAFLLNGVDRVEADKFAFLLSPAQLVKALKGEGLPARVQGRITKTHVATRLALEVLVANLPAPLAMLVPNNPEESPVFVSGNNGIVAETLISNEYADDEETLAKVIKAMKKQLKRALQDQEIRYGRVRIEPSYVADFAWLSTSDAARLELDNLVFSSPLCVGGMGIVSDIAASVQASDAVAAETASTAATTEIDRPSLLDSPN